MAPNRPTRGVNMRKLLPIVLPIVALAAAGCSSGDNAPSGSGVGGGGSAVSDGGVNFDGHMDTTPGQAGSTCATACDCQPGLSCANGKCGSGGAAYYCCTSTSCPQGSGCQLDTGAISMCGGGSSGGGAGSGGGGGGGGGGGLPGFGDLGLPGGGGGGGGGLPGFGDLGLPGGGGGAGAFCALISCTQDSDCSGGFGGALGCATCDTTAGSCK